MRVVIITPFILFSLFGLLFGVHIDEHGTVGSCLMNGVHDDMSQMASAMNMGDHVTTWQHLFALPASSALSLLMTALFVLLITVCSRYTITGSVTCFSLPPPALGKYKNACLKIYQFLITLFSNGVLHPRLFVL